jgi:hypothetical protein
MKTNFQKSQRKYNEKMKIKCRQTQWEAYTKNLLPIFVNNPFWSPHTHFFGSLYYPAEFGIYLPSSENRTCKAMVQSILCHNVNSSQANIA